MSKVAVGATPGTFLTFLCFSALIVAVLSTTFIKQIFFVKITTKLGTNDYLTYGLWGICFRLANATTLECRSKFGYEFGKFI